MNATEAADLLKRYVSPNLLSQVLAAFQEQEPPIGTICRRTEAGWELLTGPGAEEDTSEAFGALDTLLTALDTLRNTDTIDIALPGPAEAWSEALTAADGAYAQLSLLLEQWELALEREHSRDEDAEVYRDLDPFDEASPDDEDQEEGIHDD
jgi:hypothetical protein